MNTERARIAAVKRFGLTAIALLPVLIWGCATTGINRGQINLITIEQEVEMGREFSVEVEKQFELYGDAGIDSYVQSVGDRLVLAGDGRGIRYNFRVIRKDELNAFALPGGYIYIYTGLLKQLDDEAQLAAVLAHEIGHITARHATERLTAIYGYNLLVRIALGENPNFAAKLIADIFATGGLLAYSRENEYEADRLATAYSHAAGYDPEGVVELMLKLSGTEEREPGKLEELLATHPPTKERYGRVKGMIAGLPVLESPVRNAAEYAALKARIE